MDRNLRRQPWSCTSVDEMVPVAAFSREVDMLATNLFSVGSAWGMIVS
jgi:hypothetical protein